jgi:uncharacterized membrane protein
MRKTQSGRQFIRSLEAEALKKRPFLIRVADDLNAICGSAPFLVLNAIVFTGWIVVNSGLIPGIEPFDPYPFGFLTMAVSLEAIFLSIFVLISQNRNSLTSTVRDEVHMQVNLIAEQEITKILHILAEMREHMGIHTEDKELQKMLSKVNEMKIEEQIEHQIASANKTILKEIGEDIPEFVGHAVKAPGDLMRSFTDHKDTKSTTPR